MLNSKTVSFVLILITLQTVSSYNLTETEEARLRETLRKAKHLYAPGDCGTPVNKNNKAEAICEFAMYSYLDNIGVPKMKDIGYKICVWQVGEFSCSVTAENTKFKYILEITELDYGPQSGLPLWVPQFENYPSFNRS